MEKQVITNLDECLNEYKQLDIYDLGVKDETFDYELELWNEMPETLKASCIVKEDE
jgi:hypothetical protein